MNFYILGTYKGYKWDINNASIDDIDVDNIMLYCSTNHNSISFDDCYNNIHPQNNKSVYCFGAIQNGELSSWLLSEKIIIHLLNKCFERNLIF